MKPKAIIISAKGKSSFTSEQRQRMQAVMDCEFIARLDAASPGECAALAKQADLLAFTHRLTEDFNQDYIKNLNGVKNIAVFSTGVEWLDVEELAERRITVSHVPDYSTQSVAEHALSMLLTLSRRTHLSYDRARGLLADTVSLRGWELNGKTIGFIGFGRIGQAIARLLQAFSCRILYYDIRDIISDIGTAQFRQYVLQYSDVLCIAASRQRQGQCLLGYPELSAIKQGAYIINPARAQHVNNQAIIDALKVKKINGYAVDDNLPELNNVGIEPGRILQTGHTAWYSDEAMQRGLEVWVENIIAQAQGRPKNLIG